VNDGSQAVEIDRLDGGEPGAICACEMCGTVQRRRELPHGLAARCRRCGSRLYRGRQASLDKALALTLGALVLILVAHLFPFLSFRMEGQQQTATLLTGVVKLWRDGFWPIALLVLAVATVIPAIRILLQLYVFLPLTLDRAAPGAGRAFRWVEILRPWAMMEVYLLGVIVAYVKLSDLATLELGVAMFAFVALILTMVLIEATMEPAEVWERLGAQTTTRLLRWRQPRALVRCHCCGQLFERARVPRLRLRCGRCGAELHRRKPDSLARAWALLLAAAILYVPANTLPVMRVTSLGQTEPDTILSGVQALIAAGMVPVALLVLFASILVPIGKILGLSWLLVGVQRGRVGRPRQRTLAYRVIEGVGRWSMIDVFMISILVALVDLGSIARIEPGAGAICFAAVVILTMFAATAFDPRLIWDAVERDGGAPRLVRA
jgi:paraquat-inducible protein A